MATVFTLTENDYEEIKKLSIELLNEHTKEIILDIDTLIIAYQHTPTPELNEQITEAKAWLKAYEDEIVKRTAITTPVCQGCVDGVLNQQGHYGGCLQEPGFEVFPY